MKLRGALLLTLVLLGLSGPRLRAQTPATQCVVSALAGGTGDVVTVPALPCVPTTALLILTFSASNTTTAPTLQPVGATALPIQNGDGSVLAAGQLASGVTALLVDTGSAWKIVPAGVNLSTALVTPSGGSVGSKLNDLLGRRVLSVTDCGAVGDGTTDNTTAFQACLNAAAGGTLEVPAYHFVAGVAHPDRFYIASNLTHPANTTLRCLSGFPDSEDGTNIAKYGTIAAILLSSTATISAGGPSAGVNGCLFLRSGMTFPVTNAQSTYAGLALADAGKSAFTVTNSECIGFDSCFYGTGTRPYVEHFYIDCNGVTHACFDEENGNTDSGYFKDIKLQPIGSGNYGDQSTTCSVVTRAGTGFKMAGENFVGVIISQNFDVAQIELDAPITADILWPDFPPACQGTYPNSDGLLIKGGGAILHGTGINVNSTGNGIVDLSNGGHFQVSSIFLNTVGTDCVVLGSATTPGGVWSVGSLSTNVGTGMCGRYAVNYADVTGATKFYAQRAQLNGVHGGAAPYIDNTQITITPVVGSQVRFDALSTDLATTVNPFDSSWASDFRAELMLKSLTGVSVGSCTGLGTGGSCAFATGSVSNNVDGLITLTTGTGPSSSGAVQITFQIPNAGARMCGFTPAKGATAWAGITLFQETGISSTVVELDWATSAALTGSTTYNVVYHCVPH